MDDVAVFDGRHPEWGHTEAAAWLTVMDELLALVPEIDVNQQSKARRLIGEAEATLRQCLQAGVGLADEVVHEARKSVKAVLAMFPEHVEFSKCILFLSVATSRLDGLVKSAEALHVKSLPKDERNRIGDALKSVADTLATKLNEIEGQLNDSDSHGCESSQGT